MPERKLVVHSPEGLHARPAAEVARIASKTTSAVTIANNDGAIANAKSIVSLLMLNVSRGDEIVIHVDDGAEGQVLEQLVGILQPDGNSVVAE